VCKLISSSLLQREMTADFILDLPMCVYNHGKYIAQAIEGVVNQKTSYKFRLIIGEDSSKDNSREVIMEYARKYPDIIFPYFHEKNVGAFQNSKFVIEKCSSKYIALCDGDDCWTDIYKLQRQIDFLENNPEFVGCFHNVEERYEENAEKASFLYCNFPNAQKISFSDLALGNPIPTCSVVYRNFLFGKLPDWYFELRMGDWPIHLLNSQFGDFWYIPQLMGVHRIHSNSLWTLQGDDRNRSYILQAYDIMIKAFSFNPDLQNNLILGKLTFSSEKRNSSFFARCILYIKKKIF
jgi:glycosyltransferase involved in cell wall biosynthesis